jgi:hypothetical protein
MKERRMITKTAPVEGLGEANVSAANVKAFGPAETKTSTAGVVAKVIE